MQSGAGAHSTRAQRRRVSSSARRDTAAASAGQQPAQQLPSALTTQSPSATQARAGGTGAGFDLGVACALGPQPAATRRSAATLVVRVGLPAAMGSAA